MRKLLAFLVVGAFVACVDDYKSTDGAKQGEQGGPCFANNACNAGLLCAVVGGNAQCVVPDAGQVTTSSSGASGSSSGAGPDLDASPSDDAGLDAGHDGGPTVCNFAAAAFPCGGDNPPTACYGATQSCTLTGCGGDEDVRWMCNSIKECGGAGACCVGKASATLTAGEKCAAGSLQIAANPTGSVCANESSCPAGQTQLCRSNSECPDGQHCTPVKITGVAASFNGQTLGACVP